MKTILITIWEKTSSETFITKSLKEAINITKILFQDIGNLAIQLTADLEVRFPIEIAGSKCIADMNISPERLISATG
ncbi:MAG: hypothetical protein GQ561_02205 [Calditrichae bacterium]|nr:hypothetical protein [Calditrichia bacterium]